MVHTRLHATAHDNPYLTLRVFWRSDEWRDLLQGSTQLTRVLNKLQGGRGGGVIRKTMMTFNTPGPCTRVRVPAVCEDGVRAVNVCCFYRYINDNTAVTSLSSDDGFSAVTVFHWLFIIVIVVIWRRSVGQSVDRRRLGEWLMFSVAVEPGATWTN